MKDDLASRCRGYLEAGPPAHMEDYLPGSLTEIIIEHGADGRELDPELREIAGHIVLEARSFDAIGDAEIRAYLMCGATLVGEVLRSQRAR
jgi:hypothetical protein